jgi:hypothetical protein
MVLIFAFALLLYTPMLSLLARLLTLLVVGVEGNAFSRRKKNEMQQWMERRSLIPVS